MTAVGGRVPAPREADDLTFAYRLSENGVWFVGVDPTRPAPLPPLMTPGEAFALGLLLGILLAAVAMVIGSLS